MNLGHHLTVRLQDFCLLLHDTCKGKRATKRKSNPKLGLQSVKEPQRRRAFFLFVCLFFEELQN